MNEWIGHWTLFSVVGRVKTGMCLSHTSPGYTVFLIYIFKRYYSIRARFGSTYTKIGTIQRRLAWPLRKDDTQIREAFQIFYITFQSITIFKQVPLRITGLEVKAQRHSAACPCTTENNQTARLPKPDDLSATRLSGEPFSPCYLFPPPLYL